ncbi:helix-turn-helix domain-containing protein [Flagellimonas amoyensis]|uniref:helix-turn-helix domain-containing protein n=1 Tax=Flagellimonas amoyensis TaxID=2169401 RepID=UPI000D38507B|nr:XRE family transcriptional regulator [Allomuricauda amoyensis]
MSINHRQLTFAREFRGYTQTELASRIDGLSQSNLSKFEKGVEALSEDLTDKIIDFLNFPKSFLSKRISNVVENAHYRKKSTITKKLKNEFEYSIKLIGYLVDSMAESIQWPEFTLKTFDLEKGYSPEYVAQHTRKLLGLKPDEPVRNIFHLLEKNGIIIVEIPSDMKFDAVSIQTDDGFPVIILNKYFPNDRKRFNLAHELGHLLFHVLGNVTIPESRNLAKVKESEANRFAAEFLMPGDIIKNSLRGLKLSYLSELKRYWLTSMSSIIRRARDLKVMPEDRYKYLNMEFSRRGLKRNEGVNVFIDEPVTFYKGYELHKTELDYSDEELADAFCLPMDVIKTFCDTKSGNGRLRVLV